MKLEKGEISSSQLMLLVGSFLQGGLLSLSFAYAISRQDTWLAVLAALFIGLLFALVYIALANRFPGKTLMQINDLIFGPFLGKLVSIQYLYLFISSLSVYLWFIGDFVLTYLMPETPIILIMIMFSLLCAYAVRQGIEVIARICFIAIIVTSLVILITFALLIKDMEYTYFLPIFEVPIGELIQSTHIIMHVSFSEVLVFLMVIPYMNKPKQTKKSVLLGMLIGGLGLLTATIRNIAALGPLSAIVTSPSLESVRLIDIGKVITRLEVLVAMAQILLLFIITSVLYYAVVLGIAQITKLRSYKPLVLPIGIFAITLSLISYESSMQLRYSSRYITPIFTAWFYFILPLLSLLVAKLRKLPK
ncbi:endospore germination permease [Desulfosporosinus sp.]|uniref:GerAB/ArcD/ProY family transporter n=1 Tax=Desulfosporosinus sp. TaxID=157907 RepID=UPI0025BE154B|nr:endospore germination permease [Desulfosporosinus sp.]MBC2728976.1 endospore germination permease [Desulfosporosinus sp.]